MPVAVHGERHDPGSRRHLPDPACRLDTVHPGHLHIEYGDLAIESDAAGARVSVWVPLAPNADNPPRPLGEGLGVRAFPMGEESGLRAS